MTKQIDLGQFIWPDVGQGRPPPTSIQLDASNPLTRGLYLLSYGDRGYDIVGQRTPTLTAASRAIIKAGGALAFTGGSTFSGESYPDVLGAVDQLSVLVLGSIDNVANRQSLFTKGEDNPAGEWSLALGYNAGGAYSNFFFQSVQAPATGVDAKGTTTVANGEEFVVVGTYQKSGTICIYKNGKLEDSQAVGGAALRTDSTSPPLAFGVCNSALSAGGGTYYYGGKMALRAVWTRQLSAAEVAELSANPWQLFEVPMLGIKGGAGAGLFTKTVTATVGSTATRVAQARATRAAASAAAVAIAKAASTSKAATVGTAAARLAQARATRAAALTGSATVVRLVQATRSASSTVLAAAAGIKTKLLTLLATVGSSAALVRSVQATRSAATAVAPALAKSVRATRSAAVAVGVALVRGVQATRSAATGVLASAAGIKTKLLTLLATVGTAASLGRSVRKTVQASASLLASAVGQFIAGTGPGLVGTGVFIARATARAWRATGAAVRRVAKWGR